VREYNKLKKHLKHQFFSSFIDEINNIAPRDSKAKIKVEFPVFMNSFNIKSVPSFLLFFSRFIPFFISLQLKGKSKGEEV
jgi:hypothetical protein